MWRLEYFFVVILLMSMFYDGPSTGISQRDMNHYEFLNEESTRDKIIDSVTKFWETEIRDKWAGSDCKPSQHLDFGFTLDEVTKFSWCGAPPDIFDFLLTRDLSRGHIIDFNPYSPRTDPLLFSYKQLHDLSEDAAAKTEFRVIPSADHPAAASNIPVFQHNMVPLEALTLSAGRTVDEFADALKAQVQESMQNGIDYDSDEEGAQVNGRKPNGTSST